MLKPKEEFEAKKPLNLVELREKIDEIDTSLLELLAERMKWVALIGEYKQEEGLPSLDSKRWEEVEKSRIELAEKLGLDPEIIKKIYRLIHRGSLKLEDNILGGKEE